jgi:hypothetical protein
MQTIQKAPAKVTATVNKTSSTLPVLLVLFFCAVGVILTYGMFTLSIPLWGKILSAVFFDVGMGSAFLPRTLKS